jgi:CubicO group peptidase (beta-lactamase class C family)
MSGLRVGFYLVVAADSAATARLANHDALRQAPHMAAERLDDLLRDAIAQEVTPGCVALVWQGGTLLYAGAHGVLARHGITPGHRRPVSLATKYDLASLTKVLCTTTLAAQAVGRGELSLDDRLPSSLAIGDYRPTLRDLLEHASGLAAHCEFFHEPWSLGIGARDALIAAVRGVPLAAAPRTRAIYSDLGFILLGAWLESLFGARLDELFVTRIARPLGLEADVGFAGLKPLPPTDVAATEVYDAALHGGRRQHWYALREQAAQPAACGLVHDDNALVMGGVAGHAGLFGNALGVLGIARAWLERRLPELDQLQSAAVVAEFTKASTVPGSSRRAGFDGPAPDGSGATGRALSPRAYGHLGFTGVSLWIDPDAESIYVLLTNRVHPTRSDERIGALRREFHARGAAAAKR